MGVIGDLDKYTKFQTAEAIGDMANNPGGGGAAGAGMGAGMGFAMGNQMAQSMTPQQPQQPSGGAAPLPSRRARSTTRRSTDSRRARSTAATLQARIADGSVTRETLVWTEGMAEWGRGRRRRRRRQDVRRYAATSAWSVISSTDTL